MHLCERIGFFAYWLSFHSAIGNHILFGSKHIRESLDLYKDALSDKLTLFRVAFVSCDTLCHVFLDVVVEERVVVFVETGRSEEFECTREPTLLCIFIGCCGVLFEETRDRYMFHAVISLDSN